jgi:hypothetical protein
MLRPTAFLAVFALALLSFQLTAARAADETQALINQALDKQVNLSINDVLPQAMDQISRQTGVPIDIDPLVYDLLPWGQETNIRATIQNQTLREALEGITRKLGLVFVLKDKSITLEPEHALRRLARRSTLQELKELDMLAETPLVGAGAATDQSIFPAGAQHNNEVIPLKKLLTGLNMRLEQAHSPYMIENRTTDTVSQDSPVSLNRGMTLTEALDAMSRQTNATWYPWDKRIVITSKPDEIRRQLNRTISVHYNGMPLEQVLLELRQKSGVPFEIEPGAVRAVPPESRNVRLFLDNATILDALEAIQGFTGLGYVIRDNGVYFSNTNAPVGARDPVAIILHVDDHTEVLVPRSQVPPDVMAYYQEKTRQEMEKVRAKMKAEGFHPPAATLPTTRPAARGAGEPG